jgi:hypothetical protein
MFKKTIKYEDFDGNQVEQDFYFHLSKAELMAMSGEAKGIEERVMRIVAAQDARGIIDEFKALIEMSVGQRSEDGRRFVKDADTQAALFDSPAFDELLMELCTSANAAADFVNALIPEKMRKELSDALKKQQGNTETEDGRDLFASGNEDPRPAWEREDRDPTSAEMQAMGKDELQRAFTRKLQNKSTGS